MKNEIDGDVILRSIHLSGGKLIKTNGTKILSNRKDVSVVIAMGRRFPVVREGTQHDVMRHNTKKQDKT